MTRIEQAAVAVAAARAVLDGLGSLPSAPRDEVVQLLEQTAALSRILDAQRVRLAAEIAERSRGPADESICRRLGHRSPKEAVASAFGIRERDARALLSLAAATSAAIGLTGADIAVRYPRVAAAFDAGGISLAQAQAIVEHLEPAASRADVAQLGWAEEQLVAAATDPDAPLVPELLVTQARAYVAVLDPDGVLPNAERQRAMRSLRMRQQADGMWMLTMLCPPEAGSAIKALLDAYTSPRVKVAFRDGGDGADDAPAADDRLRDGGDRVDGATADGDVRDGGDSVRAPIDPDGRSSAEGSGVVDDRSPAQKRHDVLVALVQAHAASGDAPVAGGEAPVLVLTGTIEAYDAYVRGAESRDRTLTIEHTGDLLPIETIDRLACDSVIQRAVVNRAGHVLSLGTTERLFNRAQRRALGARDKGCRVPGCGMPVAWCEAHHVVPWQLGGPTDVDNGILLCNYHHHEVHAGRLLVERAGPGLGQWRVVPDLRPATPFGRTRRASRAPSATDAAIGMPEWAGSCAAEAAPDLAVKLAEPPASELPELPEWSAASSGAAPRGTCGRRRRRPRTAPVEARARHRLRAHGRRLPPLAIAARDLHPPVHIVMRT